MSPGWKTTSSLIERIGISMDTSPARNRAVPMRTSKSTPALALPDTE